MKINLKDFNLPELDIYTKLSENEASHIYEPDEGLFIAESKLVIERAMNAGYEPESFLIEDTYLEEAEEIICKNQTDVPVYIAGKELLGRIKGYTMTRGMLAAMKRKPNADPESICCGARRIAVLEDVMNPTNVGAIIRSAAALDLDAIFLTGGCCDPLYRRAARVSMGCVFQIPWAFVESAEQVKNMGFKTAAMALCSETIDIDSPELKKEEKLAIILGSEGYGLKESTINICDYKVKIPMREGVDSLNVSAAAAVAFYEIGKV